MIFEICNSKDHAQPFYWRIRFSNGKIAAVSETYASKRDAQKAIDTVKREAASAQVVDLTPSWAL